MPASHPLNLGAINFVTPAPLRATLEGCDLLLVVGAPMFQLIFPEVQSPVPPGTKIVQIDINPWELGKNINPRPRVPRRPEGGARRARRAGPQEAHPAAGPRRRGRAEKIGERTKAARARYWEQAKPSWDATPISAPRLMHEIRHALPDDALVFSEAITNSAHLEPAISRGRRGSWCRAGRRDRPGLPGRLGAALARPDRKVVGVCSDGAAMYSITALWTAAHHKIPVTYVMLSNAAYRILKLNMVEYLGKGRAGRASSRWT